MGGGEEELKTIIKSTTMCEDGASWERWLKPLRAASLLVPPLWSLLAFVLYITWSDIWKANLYAFCEQGVEGGRHHHPEFHRGADRKVNTIGHRGKWGTQASQKHMISIFELFQLCANLMTIAKWSRDWNPFANRDHACFGGQPPHYNNETATGCKGKNEWPLQRNSGTDFHEPSQSCSLYYSCFR